MPEVSRRVTDTASVIGEKVHRGVTSEAVLRVRHRLGHSDLDPMTGEVRKTAARARGAARPALSKLIHDS